MLQMPSEWKRNADIKTDVNLKRLLARLQSSHQRDQIENKYITEQKGHILRERPWDFGSGIDFLIWDHHAGGWDIEHWGLPSHNIDHWPFVACAFETESKNVEYCHTQQQGATNIEICNAECRISRSGEAEYWALAQVRWPLEIKRVLATRGRAP